MELVEQGGVARQRVDVSFTDVEGQAPVGDDVVEVVHQIRLRHHGERGEVGCGERRHVDAFVGSRFVLTQLLQFVLGYSPPRGRIRLLHLAVSLNHRRVARSPGSSSGSVPSVRLPAGSRCSCSG